MPEKFKSVNLKMDNEKSIILFWDLFTWLNHICFLRNCTLILNSTYLALFSAIKFLQRSSLLLTIQALFSLVWFSGGFLQSCFFFSLLGMLKAQVYKKDSFPCRGALQAGTLAVGVSTDFFFFFENMAV